MNSFGSHHIETARVGPGLCLFRPDNHALCLLNETASEIWQAAADGIREQDICEQLAVAYGITHGDARNDVAQAKAGWRQAGLLGNDGPRGEERGPQCPAIIPRLDRVYGGPNERGVRVRCDEPILAALLGAVLAPLACQRQPTATFTVAGVQERYSVWRDDRSIVIAGDRATARHEVLRGVLLETMGEANMAGILHACAVTNDRRAYLLAGGSGSGKTTLGARLVRDGWGYLADDLTPLCHDGRSVGQFPTAMGIKAGSWTVIGDHFASLWDQKVFVTRRLRVRYLDFGPAHMNEDAAYPVAAVIFPRYDGEADKTSISSMRPEEVFTYLIEAGSTIEGARASVRPLARLANDVPAYSIRFSDLEDALRAIRQLVI